VLAAILRRATWSGIRGGLRGSRIWAVVAIVAIGARSIRRIARAEPEVLYRTRIRPGEILVLGSKQPE
jgi:hypothetical protein